MKKLIFLLFAVIHGFAYSQCPTSTIVLDTQQKVDDFATNYPNCTNLTVSVEINGGDITNLEGLKNITSISEYLTIGKVNGSTSLKNLAGLENLEIVGKSITLHYNNKLETLNGLSGLRKVGTPGFTSSGLNVSHNPLLINLGELNNLEFFNTLNIVGNENLLALAEFGKLEATQISENNWIHIWNNAKLSSLKGLDSIKNVDGDLYIFNNNLNNLAGLEQLETVKGSFKIRREPNLTDLAGLNSLRSAGGMALEENPVMLNFAGLETLKEVTGKFQVILNPVLSSFNGLENLERVTGNLEISKNNHLQNFEGLSNLSLVTGTFQVTENAGLLDFTGLSSLNEIGLFTIYANSTLQEFTGLTSLKKVGLLNVRFNNSLTTLKGLENLNSIEENLFIERNAALVEISALKNVERMSGVLRIEFNDKLGSLIGLEKFTNINLLFIQFNKSLPSLKGLENLQSVLGISIDSNENLESLEGLSSLNMITGDELRISNNPNLLDLNALRNVQYIGGRISVDRNHKLEDLSGLQSVTAINGRIEVYNNNNLKSLVGIQNIDNSTIQGLVITDNQNLAECEVLSVCNTLATDTPATFRNNLPGCNTKAEILERCENQYSTLAGTVKYAGDGEDCENGNPVENWQVKTGDGNTNASSFTDSMGRFSFYVANGNYETSVVLKNNYFKAEPEVLNLDTSALTSGDSIRFCLKNNIEARDLTVSILPVSEARPGFLSRYELIFSNNGNTSMDGTVSVKFDAGQVSFYSSGASPDRQLEDEIDFTLTDLKPFESQKIRLVFQVFQPPIVENNAILKFKAVAEPVEGDSEPDDNTFTLHQTVVNSFDPNDITVLEGAAITKEQAEDYLNYLIRFQNTGTASAINVRIDHQLDENLDWETFLPIASSHRNKIEIKERRNVEFIFDGIHLPDSIANEPESHGYVAFKIKPKAGINVGDIIKAKAGIYFDYNPPVITNQVSTEVIDPSLDEFSVSLNLISGITCNSANNAIVEVEISGGTAPYNYQLFDSSNALLSEGENYTFGDLSAGIYTVRVTDVSSNEKEQKIEIEEPEILTVQVSGINTTCGSANDGKIEIIASGGTAPYQYRLGEGDFLDSGNFTTLTAGEYEVIVQDYQGCSFSEIITISNSDDADTDGDGIGDPCDDDKDGDGVLNGNDECENSTRDLPVDETGCTIFSLPSNNFTITTTSETCRVENNGKIEIGAVESYEYVATLNSEARELSQTFTTGIGFENLQSGSYDLCITVPQFPEFEQCYNIQITEPEDLEVYSAVSVVDQTLTLELYGGREYFIELNGRTFTTTSNRMVLPLKKEGNSLLVKTGEDCQGSYSRDILLASELVVFPNPVVQGEISIQLPQGTGDGEVTVELFSDNGKQLKRQIIQSQQNLLKLNVDGITAGIYTIIVKTGNRSFANRIIKK